MKNIHSRVLPQYNDTAKFKKLNEHIYEEIGEGNYRITLSCELEEGEDTQYPLEDILDKFYLVCTDFFEMDEDTGVFLFELEGDSYEDILEVSKLIGKRVYNEEKNGSVKLNIE